MRGLNIRQYKEPDGEETPSFDFKKWVADTGKSEGFEEYAYLDSRGILTIGHGFNLQDPATRKKLQSRGYDVDGMIKGKVKMTEAQSLPLLEEIYKESFETAKTKFSNFDAFPESAKHVVTDMIYNMGESRFDGFKKFKAALEAGDFTQAGKEIADSSYAKQVKGRATKHVDRFKELSGDPDLSKFFPREEIPMVNAPMRELTSVSPSTPTPEVMPVRNTQEPVGYTEPPIDSTDTYVWTPSGKMSVTDFVNRYGEKVYESTFKSPVPKFATGGKVGPGDEKNKGVRSTERVAQTGEFEGFESSVYQDDYGNNTIGYGFNIDNPNIRRTLEKQGFDVQGMLEGRVQMTREEALPVLDLLYNDAYKNVTRRFSNFNTLNPNAQYVLVDMMYNLGTKKFDTFKKMQAAVKANDFKTAALEIEDSNYYRQTGNRAKAHVENMWQAGKTYEIQQKYKGITGQGLADLELQQLNQSTYAPVSTGVSLPPMKKHGGLTLSYWKDLDKQYYVNSDRTPREYKSGGWTDLDRRYGYYGQYPGYAYGSHVVHGGPTWPEYAMGLDSGATLHQTLDTLRGNPKPKILDTSAQGNMPKKAEYPSYYSQGVKKYSLPEEGRSLYGDGGSLTDEYRRVRSTIPRVSFDAPSNMYTGPTTQRGITFADGGWLDSYKAGGMIKRADGSYSRRGLWDNIRANRGSGKKPTKEMLKQERKIRAAEKKADGSFVGIEPMTNLNIPAPRYNKTPDKAVMPVVYANEPNTPDWSKGAKFADGGPTGTDSGDLAVRPMTYDTPNRVNIPLVAWGSNDSVDRSSINLAGYEREGFGRKSAPFVDINLTHGSPASSKYDYSYYDSNSPDKTVIDTNPNAYNLTLNAGVKPEFVLGRKSYTPKGREKLDPMLSISPYGYARVDTGVLGAGILGTENPQKAYSNLLNDPKYVVTKPNDAILSSPTYLHVNPGIGVEVAKHVNRGGAWPQKYSGSFEYNTRKGPQVGLKAQFDSEQANAGTRLGINYSPKTGLGGGFEMYYNIGDFYEKMRRKKTPPQNAITPRFKDGGYTNKNKNKNNWLDNL